jgi:hypothetical protein
LHVQLANMMDSSGYDYRGVPVCTEPAFLLQANSKSSGPSDTLVSMTTYCPPRPKAMESSMTTIILADPPRNGRNYGVRLEKRIRKNNGVVPSPHKRLLMYSHEDDDEFDNSPHTAVSDYQVAGSTRLSLLKQAITKETSRNELLGTILKRKRSLLLIENGISHSLATKVPSNVSLTEVD